MYREQEAKICHLICINKNKKLLSYIIRLHEHLIEHLNAEIVIGTIVDISTSIRWLKSTYFFTRLRKNPSFYGVELNVNNSEAQIDAYLHKLCMSHLRSLANIHLIEPVDFEHERPSKIAIRAARNGELMARYCLAFATMKSFVDMLSGRGGEQEEGEEEDEIEKQHMRARSLCELIGLVSACHELSDIKLRTNEKSALNALNNNGKAPKGQSDGQVSKSDIVRFILDGKVKTHDMKINM